MTRKSCCCSLTATLIWPSRTAHLYIAVSLLDFFLARDIFFYEYVVHAGLPDVLAVWSVGIREGNKGTLIRLFNGKRYLNR